jgi:hypothetical protein
MSIPSQAPRAISRCPELAGDEAVKIFNAASACLSAALKSPYPFTFIRDYVLSLKGKPDWSAEEIIEVQTCVIRLIMQRMGMGS